MHGFIEVKLIGQPGAFHGRKPPSVLDCARRQLGVGGIIERGIGAFQSGVLKNADGKCVRFFAVEFHVVFKWPIHRGQAGAEDGVVEILHQFHAPGCAVGWLNDQHRLGRCAAFKVSENGE